MDRNRFNDQSVLVHSSKNQSATKLASSIFLLWLSVQLQIEKSQLGEFFVVYQSAAQNDSSQVEINSKPTR